MYKVCTRLELCIFHTASVGALYRLRQPTNIYTLSTLLSYHTSHRATLKTQRRRIRQFCAPRAPTAVITETYTWRYVLGVSVSRKLSQLCYIFNEPDTDRGQLKRWCIVPRSLVYADYKSCSTVAAVCPHLRLFIVFVAQGAGGP